MRHLAGVWLIAACAPSEAIPLPADVQGGTWFVAFGEGPQGVYAADAEALRLRGLPLNLPSGRPLSGMVHHDRSLAELGLEAGLLTPRAGDGIECSGGFVALDRSIPTSSMAWMPKYDAGDFAGWEPVAELPSSFRFAPYDVATCPEPSACLELDGRVPFACNPACTPVRAPRLPRPPQPPYPPAECRGEPDCEETGFMPRLRCPPDEAHFVGSSGCRTVARACTSEWPDVDDATAIRARPNEVAAALARLPHGGTILLTRGAYVLPFVAQDDPIRIVGCGWDTVLGGLAAIGLVRGTLEVSDVRVGSSRWGAIAEPKTELTLRRIVFEKSGDAAIVVKEQAQLTVDEVAVHGGTYALLAFGSGTLDVRRLHAEDTRAGGLLVFGKSGSISEYSSVGGGYDGQASGGGRIGQLANITLERAVIQSPEHFGLSVTNAELRLRDAVIRDVRPRDFGGGVVIARGVLIGGGPTAATGYLSRVEIANANEGVRVAGDGTAYLEDLRISSDVASTNAVGATNAARVVLHRAAITGRFSGPLLVFTDAASTPTEVHDVAIDVEGAARGIEFNAEGGLELARADVSGAKESIWTRSEVAISDVRAADATYAFSFRSFRSRYRFERLLAERSQIGVRVGDAEATGSDLTVLDSTTGIEIDSDAALVLRNFLLEGTQIGIDASTVNKPIGLDLRSGKIARSAVAIAADRCALGPGLEEIRWEDVEQPLQLK